MTTLSLNTKPGLYFWGSWLVYLLAFGLFYLNTQFVEMTIEASENTGQIQSTAQTLCTEVSCQQLQFERVFDHSQGLYDLQATLTVPYKRNKKPDTAHIEQSLQNAIATLPWYAKSRFSGKVAVSVQYSNPTTKKKP